MKNLNSAQKEAAEHNNGPLLIIAGAGTGKTTVLIERLAFLIENNLAQTNEVLITTFTDKAAQEMESRADEILPYGCFDFWIMTFHKLCEKILRQYAQDIGLPNDFKLATQTQQWILLKKNLKKLQLDYYNPLHSPDKYLHNLLGHFSRLKDEIISSEEYLKYAENLKLDDKIESSRILELARAYHQYNRLLLENNFLDFGDLIFYVIKLFKERPNILNHYRNQFKYIMVDEFQDTNLAQYELTKMLSAPQNNLAVIGDDNQSIYRFRGASMSNIMQFMDDFPSAKKIILNINYRSGQKILDSSYSLIQKNNPETLESKLGIDKKLLSGKNETGSVQSLEFATGNHEINFLVKEIKKIKEENNSSWNDFAILLRSNSDAEVFSLELNSHKIPNIFISLRGLYYKPVILDICAYLRLLDNYHETSATYRAISTKPFLIRHEDILEINLEKNRRKYHSTYEALKNIDTIPKISEESKSQIKKLLNFIKKYSQLAIEKNTSDIFVKFIHEIDLLKNLDYEKDREVFSYLNQFYQKIKEFEKENPEGRLKDFLEYFNLEMDSGDTGGLKLDFNDSEAVKIMTVHSSKGLEFDYVFLPVLVNRKFPSDHRKENLPIPDELVKEKIQSSQLTHTQEERRLFYVAMTRARKKLYLTHALDYGGLIAKKPSIFLQECGSELSVAEKIAHNVLSNDFIKELDGYKHQEIKPEPINKEILPNKFSFSQFSAFENCPLQYKFNFILKIPTPQTPSRIFGQTIHRVLNEFLAPFTTGIQQNLFLEENKFIVPEYKFLIDLLKKHWSSQIYKDQDENKKYQEAGKKILKTFHEKISDNPLPKIRVLEKAFSLKIKDYIIKGTIDRIDELTDGTLEIIDYKTGSPKEKFIAEDKRQLIIYQKASQELFNKKISKLTYYYLQDGSSASFEASEKEIIKTEEKIIDTIEEIRKGFFLANPGMLCAYCDFKNICEYKK